MSGLQKEREEGLASFEMSENPQTNVSVRPVGADEGWTSVITPHLGWFDWKLQQLWRYRDLISLFVWRDFVSVYKQTSLGPLWHIIQPLMTTVVFTVMFGRIAKLSTDGVPAFLFYLCGNLTWSYFANNINKTSSTFISNVSLLGKVYFHRLVIPISIVISNLISFAIQLSIFLIFLILYWFGIFEGPSVHLTGWIFCVPLFLLMLAGYGLGGGIIVSALTTRYRDLTNLVAFGVQLLMFASSVIFPMSVVPVRYRWIVQSNPLVPIVEGFRRGFLGAGDVTMMQVGVSFGVMLLVLAIGMMLFTHVEKTFMDTV